MAKEHFSKDIAIFTAEVFFFFFQESFEKIRSSINSKRIDFQLEDSKNNGTSHKFN